ncbi:MAG TPA: hypothetical protein VHL53_01010 [Acidimicrobiia bacterium]|nr:hypothetical protein [Acidimicrobiia bacterium]
MTLTSPGAAIAWARTIPDFGYFAEIYALFLGADRSLRRAVWLGSSATLDDLVAWPDVSLGYAPAGTGAVMLVVCRPGDGVAPTAGDRHVFALLRLAHAARGVPLADVLLVDGRRWHSLAGNAADFRRA